MTYKVLIVDDSAFFRRRVKQMLEQDPELVVVGEAKDGLDAVTKVALLKPDVVTMDIEMPVMDGITAVKRIMKTSNVPIIMFSSLTHNGAKVTLEALAAGAMDFLPKKFEDIATNRAEAVAVLQSRVKALCRGRSTHLLWARNKQNISSRTSKHIDKASQSHLKQTSTATLNTSTASGKKKSYQCLAIGASTGGPVALQRILSDLPSTFAQPIVLVQHMPGTFTTAFAERLNQYCRISVKEAQNGDELKPGCAYLAPGGMQLVVERKGARCKIKICEPSDFPSRLYKPSVDVTFASLSRAFGGDVLAIILTGMGADGSEGCQTLKQCGARIWAQDQQSSVIYGMPQAVTSAGISDSSIALDDFAQSIINEMRS